MRYVALVAHDQSQRVLARRQIERRLGLSAAKMLMIGVCWQRFIKGRVIDDIDE